MTEFYIFIALLIGGFGGFGLGMVVTALLCRTMKELQL